MSNTRKSIFIGPDGKNLAFTFALVSSLFLLWGFCNGMIDVMDKHFQEELGLTKSQSAWVQVCALPGLLSDVDAGGLAGEQARVQGRHHLGIADCGAGRLLVYPRHVDRGVLGVPAGRVHHRQRADVSGDGRESVHHGAG